MLPQNAPKIIGISGKFASGKDTAADIILKHYPQYNRKSFALNVKQIVAILTGTTLEENLTREGKLSIPPGFDKTLGTYQQIVGMSMRRDIDPDVWIKSVLCDTSYKLITDVRFKNEADAILKQGGLLIRIERDPKLRLTEGDPRDQTHPSEVDLDDYFTGPLSQHIIHNNGTLTELEEKIIKLISGCAN